MSGRPVDLSAIGFEEWVCVVFDRPVAERAWYWDEPERFRTAPAGDSVQAGDLGPLSRRGPNDRMMNPE
jgi:hypothetical protein